MRHLPSFLRRRSEKGPLPGTTFDEEHSEVCSPACRREAMLNRARERQYRDGLGRYY